MFSGRQNTIHTLANTLKGDKKQHYWNTSDSYILVHFNSLSAVCSSWSVHLQSAQDKPGPSCSGKLLETLRCSKLTHWKKLIHVKLLNIVSADSGWGCTESKNVLNKLKTSRFMWQILTRSHELNCFYQLYFKNVLFSCCLFLWTKTVIITTQNRK